MEDVEKHNAVIASFSKMALALNKYDYVAISGFELLCGLSKLLAKELG